jgi:hypothetical protein
VTGSPFFQLEIPPSTAVIVPPFRPKLIAFEFEKTTDERLAEDVPALKTTCVTDPTTALAVTVDPLRPKVMPPPFEKTRFERF